MDTTATIAIFTPLMPVVVGLLKHLFPKVDPRHFAVGFAIVVAVILGAMKWYLSEESLEAILASMGAVITFVFGVGTGLYKVQK